MDGAPIIEADHAVATGQQYQEGAGSLTSKKKHPLGPAGDWQVADDWRARRSLSKSEGKRQNGGKHKWERQSRNPVQEPCAVM